MEAVRMERAARVARNPDRTFSNYYREVGKTRMLDAKTEMRLFLRYRDKGDIPARNRIVENCLRYVVKLARQFSKNPDVYKDLISAGNLGIFRALDHYDPTKNTRFLSYATYWILLEMRSELQNSQTVTLPLWRQKALRKMRRFQAEIEMKQGRKAEDEEICRELSLTKAQLRKLHLENATCVSLDNYREYKLRNEKSPKRKNAEEKVSKKQNDDLIVAIAKALPVKERFAVMAYFGFINDPMSLRQIGNVLGLTSERVRQIRQKALGKLEFFLTKKMRLEAQDFAH